MPASTQKRLHVNKSAEWQSILAYGLILRVTFEEDLNFLVAASCQEVCVVLEFWKQTVWLVLFTQNYFLLGTVVEDQIWCWRASHSLNVLPRGLYSLLVLHLDYVSKQDRGYSALEGLVSAVKQDRASEGHGPSLLSMVSGRE